MPANDGLTSKEFEQIGSSLHLDLGSLVLMRARLEQVGYVPAYGRAFWTQFDNAIKLIGQVAKDVQRSHQLALTQSLYEGLQDQGERAMLDEDDRPTYREWTQR